MMKIILYPHLMVMWRWSKNCPRH